MKWFSSYQHVNIHSRNNHDTIGKYCTHPTCTEPVQKHILNGSSKHTVETTLSGTSAPTNLQQQREQQELQSWKQWQQQLEWKFQCVHQKGIIRTMKSRTVASEPTLQYRRQCSIDKLPSLFNNISNKGVINLTNKVLSVGEQAVLAMGPKFITTPQASSDYDIIDVAFMNFCRTVRIKKQFCKCDNDFNKTLYIPNSTFEPDSAGCIIEEYLARVRDKLVVQLENHPDTTCNIKIPKIFNIAIKNLTSDQTILIKLADKNLGVVIVYRDWYEKEALRQLLNTETYTKVDQPPTRTDYILALETILSRYHCLFEEHADQGNRGKYTQLAKYIIRFRNQPVKTKVAKPLAGVFYMTIKVHKAVISGRPIVSGMNSATIHASKYLDSIFQPIMKATTSYIRNSTDLVTLLEDKTLPTNCVLLSADVENMYPSININDGLILLRRAINRYNSKLPTGSTDTIQNIDMLIELTEWVLKNNYFEFGKSTFWLQITGTAMGTPVAVTFACIYMSELEFELTLQNNTIAALIYYRYIDDVFGIFKNEAEATEYITAFNKLRPQSIKLITTHLGTTVDFLDLTIHLGERYAATQRADITLFQKPQNSYLYLPKCSFHNQSVFKFTIIATINRYRVNCTNDTEFNNYVTLFYQRLKARGYEDCYLLAIINRNISRTTLIEGLKNKLTDTFKNSKPAPTVFKTFNTPREQRINIKQCIALPEQIWSDPDSSLIFPNRRAPIICFKRTKNLKEEFIQSRYNFTLNNNTNTTTNSTATT